MDDYLLSQKKGFYQKLLRTFDYENKYQACEGADYDSLKFIDKYRIIDFFTSLLDSFSVENDLSNSINLLDMKLKEWNEKNPTRQIDKTHLLKKYYVLIEDRWAIVNPEVTGRGTSQYTIDRDYVDFVILFSKTTFFYPLFEEYRWKAILEDHNKKYSLEFTKDILLDGKKNIHSMIFHNHKGFRDAFLEALKRKINHESYSAWSQNIEYYFSLLMEIAHSEVSIHNIIQSMDKNKQKILATLAFNKLKEQSKQHRIGDLNFLSRLKYVPYELEGENITSPVKNSRLVAYKSNYYDNLNIFDRLDKVNRCFGNFEFNHYYSKLIKEISFIFRYLRNLFTVEQWEEIMETNSNIYLYYFSTYVLDRKDKLLQFKSIHIAPLIIDQMLIIEEPHYERNKNHLFTEDFKVELIQFYLEYIRGNNSAHFSFLMDFYFDLSRQQGMNNKDTTLVKKIKDKVVTELGKYVDQDNYRNILLEALNTFPVKDNFYLFDILSYCNGSNNELRDRMVDLIIQRYLEILSTDDFYSNYYDFKGINNLLAAIDTIRANEDNSKGIFIDWAKRLRAVGEEDKIDWHQYFLVAKKLRFHLGVLCKFIVICGWHDNIGNYILDTFKQLKKIKIQEASPLSWEEILYDTIRIPANDILRNEEILTFHIVKLLEAKDSLYVKNYVEEIVNYLNYFEAILFKDLIYIKKDPDKNLEAISLGMAIKSAYFLLNNENPIEALHYVNFIEDNLSGKITYFHEHDYLNLLKYYCFINIKDYDKAMEAANKIQDKSKSIPKIATVQYFKKNYSLAKQLFEKHLEDYKPEIETIVNYSAVLISMDMNKEAIEWCEQYINEYKEDYLLNANLACAYGNIDNVKSLYYFNEAKNKNPEYKPAIYGTVDNINRIVGELPEVIDSLDEFDKKGNLAKTFTENSQKTIRLLNKVAISDDEVRILKHINKAIQLISERPINIEKLSENELSDMIRDCLKMALDCYGYEVVREAPQGYAASKPGELDFFIYKSGENYRNIATGENKLWSQDKFKRQMGQLFGYLREYGGFGFTIIFNKETQLEKVLREREIILNNYYFENDKGEKIFDKIGAIVDMGCYSKEISGVLLTLHKNPEVEDSYVRIYHYIVNTSRQDRKHLAKQVRKK
ncbi:tetratricopeptide repeat protein [Natronincola ferrireducens]|uniref:Uncharacterized protein n=1 Tax=Natronincola ferrireducens TaxID=393762 RepID=A0A1G8X7F3_9FIRM|nr:hypothetical protein [Natronincola ferrireducens]SDJ86532.1 hypothetical protein SAMN05660472_00140 [Natronincola ferrireducens]